MKHRLKSQNFISVDPAAFRRLCVETELLSDTGEVIEPAAFRRLCVETSSKTTTSKATVSSRLQAAVC